MASRFLLSSMVAADHRWCVGGTLSHRACAADKLLGSAGGHGLQKKGVQRSGAQTATDTLSVAWLRGGFGRGARPSSTGFRDQMDRIDDVYAGAQPSGVPPPVHESSHGNAHIRLLRIACQVVLHTQRLWR